MVKIDSTLERVKYEQCTMEDLLERGQSGAYDLVCCSEVIEHVNEQESFLRNAIRLVRPDHGLFFLSSIA